jgi:hypothetical protein
MSATWTESPEEVRAAAPEALLTAVEALTHRIHNARAGGDLSADAKARAQRDIVRAEILRRMGEGR